MVKNRSIRPPSNDNLGPKSEFVHEMVGLSPNFGPLSTWTGRRSGNGRLRPRRPALHMVYPKIIAVRVLVITNPNHQSTGVNPVKKLLDGVL